jgi:hypothetical protein
MLAPMTRSILPILVSCAIVLGACSREPQSARNADLQKLLTCNDAAIGGDALRAATRVDYELDIAEPDSQAMAHYTALHTGEMRIDVYRGDERVYSEFLDSSGAWELPQGASAPRPSSADGAAALRHGLEQPGHLWTLADMVRNGHTVSLEDGETIAGVDYRVVKVTLRDGFPIWYWIDESTCLIARSRNFRAYHPDIDPNRRWTESVFEDYQEFDGIRKPRVTRDVDFATGNTVGQASIRSFKATRS